ncbi:MAG TPA: DUF1080 domain-containing protein [Acidobacteriota bacterium]
MRKFWFVALLLLMVFPLSAAKRKDKEKGWIDLFNGKDLSGWHLRKADGLDGWKVLPDGVYENTKPSTDLMTDGEFYDFQLHVEFKIPPGSNSGVYMRDKYEIQIFDSYGKPVAINGCGALYRKVAPAVNVCGPAGEWQSFDMTFVGRRLTVFHNQRRIHDNIDVGPTGTGAASNREDSPGPLRLQGDHDSVSFRNLRIRPISKEEGEKLLKNYSKIEEQK